MQRYIVQLIAFEFAMYKTRFLHWNAIIRTIYLIAYLHYFIIEYENIEKHVV